MRQSRQGAGVPRPQARRARALGVSAALVGGELVPGDARVEEGRIVEAGLPSRGGSDIAAPGFVDLHVNGFAGVDFLGADARGYTAAGEALWETGVVAFRPTFITAPEAAVAEALRVAGEVARSVATSHASRGAASHASRGAATHALSGAAPTNSPPAVLGAHLEGPFISRLGAHPAEHRRDPDAALLARLLDAGPVGQVTLAPELPGALELVDLLVARGVTVSAGHSDATALEARAGFARGITAVTHVFNAMRRAERGEPGIAFAALAHPRVTVQLIADRLHVPDDRLRTVLDEAAGRVALVTDAAAATGMPDGDHALGPLTITARDGVPRTSAGRLAAGAATMDAAVRNVVALGLPLEDALAAASAIPARLARHEPRGVVVLDDRLEVVRTVV